MHMPELSETEKQAWRDKYASFFALYRNRYPRLATGTGWRENRTLDSWAHEMVAAALLPGWLQEGLSERDFGRLRKTFTEKSEQSGYPESTAWNG